MKLYSTIKSERASKGQGGNDFVSGVFTCDENEVVKVTIESHSETEWIVTIWEAIGGTSTAIYPKQATKEKGIKQKGEKIHVCRETGAILKHCPECGRE